MDASAAEQTRPKCSFSMPLKMGSRGSHYTHFTHVHSPTQQGVPTERFRRWTDFDLKPHTEGMFDDDPAGRAKAFQDIFFRKQVLDGSIYLVATTDMTQAHR